MEKPKYQPGGAVILNGEKIGTVATFQPRGQQTRRHRAFRLDGTEIKAGAGWGGGFDYRVEAMKALAEEVK